MFLPCISYPREDGRAASTAIYTTNSAAQPGHASRRFLGSRESVGPVIESRRVGPAFEFDFLLPNETQITHLFLHSSHVFVNTGLTSTTGVPSIASSGATRNFNPSISSTFTRCNPNGFGRSGDRVANTPISGLFLSAPGCTFITLRRPSCSQVIKIISSPVAIPSTHFANFR